MRGRPSRTKAQAARRPQAVPLELLFLPGLEPFVRAEAASALGVTRGLELVPGREDSLSLHYSGRWEAVLSLRTIVAAFAVLSFPVPRPKSLISGEYFPQIVDTVQSVRRLSHARPGQAAPESFRFEAAGRDSVAFQRLAAELATQTGLRHDRQDGELVLRFRRTPDQAEGWDALVRLSGRPLSDRSWRVADFPGAVNGTIAAAMAQLTAPAPRDRVANLMCGSGTLLIERLLAGSARTAVAIDRDAAALQACRANVAAAGLGTITVRSADVGDDDWLALGPFDVLLADPPWGHLVGEHRESEATHLMLLRQAHAAAAPGARFAVLTHEIRVMERCLDQVADLWQPVSQTRVFQKGHHPRIYLLHAR
jgi:predicted RNA methylase